MASYLWLFDRLITQMKRPRMILWVWLSNIKRAGKLVLPAIAHQLGFLRDLGFVRHPKTDYNLSRYEGKMGFTIGR